jgi:hypothetical protein
MTKSQFVYLCNESNIDPSIALENDDVIKAIKSDDVEMLQFILDNEF